jgi:hypothetical protein
MSPPKPLENLLRLLLPPACREHVLGDLQERYQSPKSYLIDALSILAPVIISRIRRTTDFQICLIEAFTVYLSFATAAWYLGPQDFLYERSGFLRLAIPTIVIVLALLICNAYSDLEKKSFSKPILQSLGSISFAFFGQAVIFDTLPSLAVPLPTMFYGALLSLLFVSTLRLLFPPVQSRPQLAYLSERRSLHTQKLPQASIFKSSHHRAGEIQSRPKSLLFFTILAVFLVAVWLLAPRWHAALLKARLGILTTIILLVVYQIRKSE